MDNERQIYVDASEAAQRLLDENPLRFRRMVRRRVRIMELLLIAPTVICAVLAPTALVSAIAVLILPKFAWGGELFAVAIAVFVMSLICLLQNGRRVLTPMGHPLGLRVEDRDAPRLNDLLADLRKKLRTPPVHYCMVRPDLAASVYTKRRKLIGPRRTYVCLGVGLLAGLSDEQVRAILAHEQGHLTTWSYRLGVRAGRVLEVINRHEVATGRPTGRWLNRRAIRMNASANVMRRATELEADQFTRKLVDAGVAGSALLRSTLLGHYFNAVFYQDLEKQAGHRATPPDRVISDLIQTIRDDAPRQDAKAMRHLHLSLKHRSNKDETHPAISDRLAAMGCELSDDAIEALLRPPAQNAWDAWFDPNAARRLVEQLNGLTSAMLADSWHMQHQSMVAVADQLREPFDLQACDDVEILIDRASMEAHVNGPAAATPILHRLLSVSPNHTEAHLMLADVLALELDDACVPHYQQAQKGGPFIAVRACRGLYQWWMQQGDIDAAECCIQAGYAHETKLEKADFERRNFNPSVKVEGHGLSRAQVERITSVLWRIPPVRQAYLVRRQVQHLPERPAFILLLEVELPWSPTGAQRKLLNLCQFVASQLASPVFRHEVLVLPTANIWAPLAKRVARIDGTQILTANRTD